VVCESGVDNWDDAFGYGPSCRVLPRQPRTHPGGRAGVVPPHGETKGFPYIAVDWKITDDLRLSNPFARALRPAGLELSYGSLIAGDRGGGAYRSFRFRLDDSGVAPNGVGELESTVGYHADVPMAGTSS